MTNMERTFMSPVERQTPVKCICLERTKAVCLLSYMSADESQDGCYALHDLGRVCISGKSTFVRRKMQSLVMFFSLISKINIEH